MCSVYKFMQVGQVRQEIDGRAVVEGGARRGGQADSPAAGKGDSIRSGRA